MRIAKRRGLLPRRRYRTAFYAASVFSGAAALLAVLPKLLGPAAYDPTVAVITATLIAVIWSCYFTYRAVNNEPITRLDFGFGYQRQPVPVLSFSIQNQQCHEVDLIAALRLVSAAGTWSAPPPFAGAKEDKISLRPGEAFHGKVELQGLLGQLPAGSTDVLVTAEAEWVDEVLDSGTAGPKTYLIDLEAQTMRRLYSASELEIERARITGH